MTKKILTALAVLSFAIGSANATTLTINDAYDFGDELDHFFFNNLSVGDVTIFMDTLTGEQNAGDGLGHNASMAIWAKVPGTPVSGQPQGIEWTLIDQSDDAERPENIGGVETGFNIFGVQYKNGYIKNDLTAPGDSDPGLTLANLAIGEFLITTSGQFNAPNANVTGDNYSLGFAGIDAILGETTVFPHAYNITIEGDVSFGSPVPVPAAVWLFGTAIAGLGVARRSKKTV